MDNLSVYMSIKEFAERIGMKPKTIIRYRREKPEKLPPSYDFFGHPRFKRSEVEEWEESCKRMKKG